MKIKILLLALFLWFMAGLVTSCKDLGVPPERIPPQDTVAVPNGLDSLGLHGMFVVRMKYVAPYLYACAASEGVWRRDIETMLPWEFLGLADPALGRFTSVGAWDIDVNGQDILVAYKAYSSAKPRPDSATAIWGSRNGGSTWFKSDYGIEETFDYNVEGNVITSVRYFPNNPELAIAVYERAVYRSTDAGLNWSLILGRRGIGYNYGELRWNPYKPDELWNFGVTAFFSPFLRCLEDSGSSITLNVDFNALGFPTDAGVTDVAFKPNSQTVLAATTFGMIKSDDGGSNWLSANLLLPDSGYINVLSTNPHDSRQLLMAGGRSIYSANDDGSTIVLLHQLKVNFIFCLEFDSSQNRVFIGTVSGIYVVSFE